MEYKNEVRENFELSSNEQLINKYEEFKKELLHMKECLNDKSISAEQKSEFLNSDIPNIKENMGIIEEILKARKDK